MAYQTQIVVSEAKNPIHVLDAALMGADVAALPGSVIEQLFRHPLSDDLSGGETLVKASADRVLYLARVVLKSLKENRNLEQKSDDETVRRAVVRELTDSLRRARLDRGEGAGSARETEEPVREGPRISVRTDTRGRAAETRRLIDLL